MGQKQNNILKYLNSGFDFSPVKLPNIDEYKTSSYYREIFDIYKELGGILEEIPFGCVRPQYIDFFINGNILELDEENHFNRYRLITLKASIYKNSLSFNTEKYIQYCEMYSNKCRKDGRFWKRTSSEKQFGKSDPNGIFENSGSSRYKQRAFYDMLKDYLPYIAQIPVRRVSIYDTVVIQEKEVTVEKVLKDYRLKSQYDFQHFIESIWV